MLLQAALARVLILTGDAAAIIALDAPPGGRGALARDRSRRCRAADAIVGGSPLPRGDGFIRAATEQAAIAELRNHLSDLDFPGSRPDLTSYWHKDAATAD